MRSDLAIQRGGICFASHEAGQQILVACSPTSAVPCRAYPRTPRPGRIATLI